MKLVTAVALATTLVGWSAAQARDIRLGSPWTTTSTPHVGPVKFAEEVTRLMQGELKVQVYPDSQLGDIQALITGLQAGTVDMSQLAIGNAGVLKGGSPLNVAYTPYLFKDKAAAERALNSPVLPELYEQLAKESGVRIFAVYGARSPRALHTTKGPARTPAEVKGLRIRIPPVDAIRLTIEAWGARPIVLGLGDTYMAISRGQVDGHEVGIDEAHALAPGRRILADPAGGHVHRLDRGRRLDARERLPPRHPRLPPRPAAAAP